MTVQLRQREVGLYSHARLEVVATDDSIPGVEGRGASAEQAVWALANGLARALQCRDQMYKEMADYTREGLAADLRMYGDKMSTREKRQARWVIDRLTRDFDLAALAEGDES